MRKKCKRKVWAESSPLVMSALHAAHYTSANAEYDSKLMTIRLKLWSMDHGQDATDTLSLLMTVIGAPCEAGARAGLRDAGAPWVKQLHGALRSIRAMCLNRYKWDASQAAALDVALEVANKHRAEVSIAHFYPAFLEATAVSEVILRHEFNADHIV